MSGALFICWAWYFGVNGNKFLVDIFVNLMMSLLCVKDCKIVVIQLLVFAAMTVFNNKHLIDE